MRQRAGGGAARTGEQAGEEMIELEIPGFRTVKLEHLVLDVNGTLSLDGHLIDGVAQRVILLKQKLTVHLLTADTYRTAGDLASTLGARFRRVGPPGEAKAKRDYVRELGARGVVAIGNGANDVLMMEEAELGIAVLGPEGAYAGLLRVADVVARDIACALDCLLHPVRLVATLRR